VKGKGKKMDAVSEGRLKQVFPALAAKVREMADVLAKDGFAIRVVQGLRTWAEQDALYAAGRTAPGKIVTNCPGGRSYHNFGLAVDLVPSTRGPGEPFDPDWNAAHPAWKRMEEIGVSVGLVAGAQWRSFPDAPHFQLTGRFPVGSPSQEVAALYHRGSLQAIWDAVSDVQASAQGVNA
jgi:peptidoglycan L-alanyl-D-glutamate endopeptidase CwlK